MSAQSPPEVCGVHLIGSVPLASTEDVFCYACKQLPPGYLRCIPDGETGVRWNFIDWQRHIFPQNLTAPWFAPKKEVSADEVEAAVASLPALHTTYDDAAISSYATFRKLKEEGVIPANTRFQVSLPTPVAVLLAVEFAYRPAIEPIYEEALLRSLTRIQTEIPAQELAVQWDVAPDIGMIEGVSWIEPWFSPVQEGVEDRLVRLASYVRDDVEMGFHFCYGDMGHKHWMEPRDTGTMARLAGSVLERVKRRVDWIHMPVPKDRDDVAYLAPLKGLKLDSTSLFLGLVHANDEEGTQKRIQAAGQAGIQTFGVATECGMGRTPVDELDSIFQIFTSVSKPYA
jgi:hypothetical protein